jgi:hypothetical protein
MWMLGISLSATYDIAEHVGQLLLSLGALEVMFMSTWQVGVGDISLARDIGRTLLVL